MANVDDYIKMRMEEINKKIEFLNKMESYISRGEEILPKTRHKAWKYTVYGIESRGYVEIEDPTEILLQFMEAWSQDVSDEKLDEILNQLEMPDLCLKFLEQAMGRGVVGEYLKGYCQRQDEKLEQEIQ